MYYDSDDDEPNYDEDEFDNGWDDDESLEDYYNSDEFFIASDSEEMKQIVEGYKKSEDRYNKQGTTHIELESGDKFEYWELLPFELKEMILDELDFDTWLNVMICTGNNKGYYRLPYFSIYVTRFSFFSDIIQEGSKEREQIRIRVNNKYWHMVLKIKECEGYCTFSWNYENSHVGSINIFHCSYLKVAEKFMKIPFNEHFKSLKMIVMKDKADPSAQCVSKWPFFHTFCKDRIGLENDEKKFVDEQSIVNFITEKTRSLDVQVSKYNPFDRRMNCIVTLPQLDAKKVMDSINEQLPEILADREKRKLLKRYKDRDVKRYSVTLVNENTINIDGPMREDEYKELVRNDEHNDGDVE